MNKDLPRAVSDIPEKHQYSHPRIWSILDDGKRITGALDLDEEHLGINFECKRSEVDYFFKKQIRGATAKGGEYSRALVIDSTSWENPFTRVLKREKAEMRLSPALLVLQESSDPIIQKISYVEGYLPGIAQWFERDFLEFDHDKYHFKEPNTIYYKLPLGKFATIKLNAKLTIDIEKPIIEGEFYAYTESFVRIDFEEPTSFLGAINLFSHVENFFNFIFSTPHKTHVFTSSNRKRGERNIPLYIISPHRKKGYERKDKKSGSSMLFSWEDVSNRDDVFINWALDYDNFHEIIDTLILLRSTNVSEEMRFTTIINALEAVHRRFLDKKPSTDEEFNERVENILSKIEDENDKNLVRESVRHKNEMSLRQRLKNVYAIGESVGIDKPTKNMTNLIINTRNYFTHGDESMKDKVLNYSDLYYANSLLGKYLKIILLARIGVNEDDLKNIVAKSPHFQYNFRDEPHQISKYFF